MATLLADALHAGGHPSHSSLYQLRTVTICLLCVCGSGGTLVTRGTGGTGALVTKGVVAGGTLCHGGLVNEWTLPGESEISEQMEI